MSRDLTHKGVDKFVELTNDKRFQPYLFASGIAHESPDVQRMFFDTAISYLNILANNYSSGMTDYFRVADIASMSYQMYRTYLESGGEGMLFLPTLDTDIL